MPSHSQNQYPVDRGPQTFKQAWELHTGEWLLINIPTGTRGGLVDSPKRNLVKVAGVGD